MKTEVITTMIYMVFLVHFAITISPNTQPSWLFSLVSLSLAVVAVTLPFVVTTTLHAHRNAGATATIPGPRGWPLVGSLPAVSGPLMHRRLATLADAHGARRLMSLTLGATPVVISSHPDTAREILSGAAFVDRPPKGVARELMFCRAIGFAPAGEYWRRLRRIAGTGMLSPHRMAALGGLRCRIADDMVRRVADQMERSGEVAMRALLQRASLESMAGSVLGLKGVVVSEELGEMGLAARVRGYFGKIIEERRVVGDYHERDDLLSYMLSLPEEERLEDSDVIAVLWEMIFRGVDVVAILLEWAMARMSLHSDIQSKAQEEMDAAVGRLRPITDSDVPSLRFLQWILKETLRMHPPGPLSPGRAWRCRTRGWASTWCRRGRRPW
ncbi:unnamed protein product [Miscanthus lutarioriparius]|uniref:Cytochrome P450 n=1 Tax=Miscanthus lutarioriparius TaxID=422564 RepID=A0A811SR46_9POAL|nr:unnamed protein product [Miscanthus lutarioriparius]